MFGATIAILARLLWTTVVAEAHDIGPLDGALLMWAVIFAAVTFMIFERCIRVNKLLLEESAPVCSFLVALPQL